MGTFCLILYNPTGVSIIFYEIGSLKLIIYIKNIYLLLMNSLDDRSASLYLLRTIQLANNKYYDKIVPFWFGL